MSSVPLMSLKPNLPSPDMGDANSEDEEDPLESLLTGMNFRAQKRRSRTFWSSLIFAGMISFVVGFASSYLLFVMLDKNAHPRLRAATDANPAVATLLLNAINATNIATHIRDLNALSSSNESQNLHQAKQIHQYFIDQGFDSVSSLTPSTVLLSYYNYDLPNKVVIISDNGVYNGSSLSVVPHARITGGLSVSTRITGRSVVYANFGRESDFLYLKAQHVPLKDAIILARIGKAEPVSLVETALRHGAKAVLLFADAQQYPDAANGNKALKELFPPSRLGMLQGSHGNASLPNMPGVDNGVGCVPVQLIPTKDAEYMLRYMNAPRKTPSSWMGGFAEVLYGTGPGFIYTDWQLSVDVHMTNVEKTFYNVMAVIQGSHEPDRFVLLANNRQLETDGEPSTTGGTAAMMELAKIFSSLRHTKAWQPRRSIAFCSWGGRSSASALPDEWGQLLESRTVAYLGLDAAVRGNGSLHVRATPLLATLAFQASALVPNPSHDEKAAGRRTVNDTWVRAARLGRGEVPTVDMVRENSDSWSNVYNRGIPSLDFHYGDTHDEFNTVATNWTDSNYTYHRAVTQLWGILAWNLADSLVLPLDVTQYATFLNHSLATIGTTYQYAIKKYALSLDHLAAAVHNFANASVAVQKQLDTVDKTNDLEMRMLNDMLFQLERSFLHYLPVERTNNALRHTALARGTHLDNHPTAAFGILQDLLGDLTACSEYENHPSCGDTLRGRAVSHLAMLSHCVTSATYALQDPRKPLTLHDV